MLGHSIRAAAASDAPALAKLANDAFVAKFGHLYNPADLNAYLVEAYDVDYIRSEIEHPERKFQVVVNAEGDLRAYCKFSATCSLEEAEGYPNAADIVELKQMYTAPDATGHGFGTSLILWALDEARAVSAREVRLTVYSDNQDAQRFYRRHGFEKIGDISFWVGQHRDHEFLFRRKMEQP